MSLKPSLAKIKKELNNLCKFEVIIYGSYITDNFTQRSDIDIAIINREKNINKNIKTWKNILKRANPEFHINIFELLPLYVKADIIDNYIILFGHKLEISEYFYHYRKLWKDVKYRYYYNQFTNFKEKMRKMRLNPL